MNIDRASLCSQVTRAQLQNTKYAIISGCLMVNALCHAEKVLKEVTEDFLKKSSVPIDKHRFIHINVRDLGPQILEYSHSELYNLIHGIFSKIYPKFKDDELQVLSTHAIPTSTNYSKVHKQFDDLLIQHTEELRSTIGALDSAVYVFTADKVLQLLKEEAKKQMPEEKIEVKSNIQRP